ncbi:MAG: hypothetical protein HOV70_20035 [Streptomyces sp.]|nr:hypothetical protein [Streptomyces sp.]
MNQYTVTAPEAGFSGESAGVLFKEGVGRVDDSSKEGRAAIEYFRRRGYSLTSDDLAETDEAEPEEQREFDPAKAGVDDVLAYLADADLDEATRVLDAEAAAKKPRVSIVGKREEILAEKQPTPPAPATETKGAEQ